jgi:lysophospholipase L1-like esterase
MKQILMKAAANAVVRGALLALCSGASAAAGEGSGSACATVASPRTTEYPWMSVARWNQMHEAQEAIADGGNVDLLFVGDSITEGWKEPIWSQAFGAWKPANFGIGGDRTGNVLWRLRDGHAAKLHPKAVVLLIGVNNFNFCGDTPAQVFDGVRAVVGELRGLYPQARILVNGVFPYDQSAQSPKRAKVADLNRMIATLDDGKQVVFRNYGARFLQPDGDISTEIMGDFLHLTPKGYQIWADAMAPDIRKLME